MKFQFDDLGIYNVDVQYLKYLHDNVDTEVYYSATGYGNKPFLGLVIGAGEYKYFIPFTSGKIKHLKWRASTDEHFLVYELFPKNTAQTDWVYRSYDDQQDMHILSVLDIKKMIPIPDGAYTKIEFDNIMDTDYKALLLKEYAFCKSIQDNIAQSATKIYEEQKSKGKVYKFYCDFTALEDGCKKYVENN